MHLLERGIEGARKGNRDQWFGGFLLHAEGSVRVEVALMHGEVVVRIVWVGGKQAVECCCVECSGSIVCLLVGCCVCG
jgi:hypothetical protein